MPSLIFVDVQIIKNKRNFLLQVYALTLVACLAILVLQTFFAPNYKIILFALFALLLTGGIWGIVKTDWPVFMSHYYVTCFYLIMLCYTACTGGLAAPGVAWFLFCPLISFLTLPLGVSRFWLCVIIVTLTLFFLFPTIFVIDSFNGGTYWYFISYLLFFVVGYRIISILYIKVTRKNEKLKVLNAELQQKHEVLIASQEEIMEQHNSLKIAERSVVNKNKKLEKFLDLMLEISRMEELHNGNLHYSIQTLHRELLKAMQLDSVGFWEFMPACNAFKRIDSIKNSEHSTLKRGDLSVLFDLLEAGTILRISEGDPEMNDIRNCYGYEIRSFLGCPYFIDGKFAGFISCTTNANRQWSTEEVIFVRAVSDALTLSFRSYHRKEQQTLLEEKQHQIQELNESLEEKVIRRTAELKIKNDQLSEFAFINAHKIRGPVCRLLGLNNLLSMTSDPEEIILLRTYISASIMEMDEITRNATKLLTEHD